jgi:hypothetical protein
VALDAGEAGADLLERDAEAVDAVGLDQLAGEREAERLHPGHEGGDAPQHGAALVVIAGQGDGEMVVALGRGEAELRVDLVLDLDDVSGCRRRARFCSTRVA